jgi:translation initiation factor 4G
LASAQELVVPGFGCVLVRVGVEKAFDSMVEAEQNAIADVVVELAVRDAIVGKDIRDAVGDFTSELEDISLDIPAAPKVLGRVMGCAAARGLLGLDIAAAQAGTVESAEPRRAFIASILHAFKELNGEEKLISAIKEHDVDVAQLLEHDTEFEGHLENARKFAEDNELAGYLL